MKACLLYILALFSLISIAACTPEKEIVKEVYHDNTNENKTDSGGGSTSWGGGNGLCDTKDNQKTCRPLESFMFDVTQQTQFKESIRPIIENLSKILPKFAADLYHIGINRKWYAIPGSLDGISSSNIGVPFTSDQLAIQSLFSVFVYQISFEKIPVKDSALLILHELVMGTYLLNYTSNKDRCLADSVQLSLEKKDDEYRKARKKCWESYPGDSGYQKFTLEESDYNKIRHLTEWLFEKSNEITKDELSTWLFSNQFKRYPIEDSKTNSTDSTDSQSDENNTKSNN